MKEEKRKSKSASYTHLLEGVNEPKDLRREVMEIRLKHDATKEIDSYLDKSTIWVRLLLIYVLHVPLGYMTLVLYAIDAWDNIKTGNKDWRPLI